MIISVGYRVNSVAGIKFRNWAIRCKRIINIKNNYKPQEFKNLHFFDVEFYDSYTLIQSILENAKNEIIIIDNYVDRTILDRLVVKNSKVKSRYCSS
jgi:hypothetical protein